MLYILNMVAAMHDRLAGDKDRGATATEYAILVAFIALILVVGAFFFGGELRDWFSDLGTEVDNTSNTLP